ncbi:hypothetical protein ACFS07_34760 [Undibacterium arcticum]
MRREERFSIQVTSGARTSYTVAIIALCQPRGHAAICFFSKATIFPLTISITTARWAGSAQQVYKPLFDPWTVEIALERRINAAGSFKEKNFDERRECEVNST